MMLSTSLLIVVVFCSQTDFTNGRETFLRMEVPVDCQEELKCADECHVVKKYNPKNELRTRRCHCDDWCSLFGDCCVDYFKSCKQLQKYNDIVRFLYNVRRQQINKFSTYNMSRVAMFSSCRTIYDDTGPIAMFMINRCPDDYAYDDIRERCETRRPAFPFSIPVTNRWNMNEIFANVFCALCHKIPKTDMIVWNSQLRCKYDLSIYSESISNLESLIRDCDVHVSFHHLSQARLCDPRPKIPRCQLSTNTSRSSSTVPSLWELDLFCHSYTLPVKHRITNNTYRNSHCLDCEDVTSLSQGEYTCLPDVPTDTSIPRATEAILHSIYYNVSISADYMTYTLRSDSGVVITPTLRCPGHQTAYTVLNKCVNKSQCLDNSVHVPKEGCYQVFQSWNGTFETAKSPLLLKVKFNTFSKPNFTNAVTELESSLNTVLRNVLLNHGFSTISTVIRLSSVTEFINWNNLMDQTILLANSSVPFIHMTYESVLKLYTKETLSDILTIIQITFLELDTQSYNSLFPVEMIVSNANNVSSTQCRTGQKTIFRNVDLFSSGRDTFAKFKPTTTLVNLMQSKFALVLTNQLGVVHLNKLALCLSDRGKDRFLGQARVIEMDCQMIKFTNKEYKIVEGDLHFLDTDHVIGKDKYVVNGLDAFLCVDTVKQFLTQPNSHPGYYIYKGLVIAVCASCMIIILVVKLRNHSYKDSDSRLVLGIVSCMLLVFLIDVFEGFATSIHVRIFVSSITHLLWLLIFCLHTIRACCLLHESKQLFSHNNTNVQKIHHAKKYRFQYTLLGLGALTVILVVVICLSLEKHNSAVYIGYGQGKLIWWMDNWLAMLLAYVLPAGLAGLAALWCLLYDLWYGRKVNPTWMCRHRCVSSICVSVLLLVLLLCCLSAEITELPAMGYLYYTVLVITSLFLLYTLVITDLIIESYMLTTDFQEPVTIISQTRKL